MVNGYPKPPLFRIDGERGFCILGHWEIRMIKDMLFKVGMCQQSQPVPIDHGAA